MAGLFNFPHNDRDKDFEDLPPLVPEGASIEERDRIIAEIVQVWSTPLPVMSEYESGCMPSNGVTLDRVKFYDDERRVPIDLGELIKQVQVKIEKLSDEDQRRCAITLRGCRIEICKAQEIEFLCSLKIFACYFGDGVSFEETSFSGQTYFMRTIFGDKASFRSSYFGDHSSFESAKFGDKAVFGGVTFGEGTNFMGVIFGDDAVFAGASFGEGVVFVNANFGHNLSFAHVSFDGIVVFVMARFGDDANFMRADFGDDASFSRACFGINAYFDKASFGRDADFAMASLRNASFRDIDAVGISFTRAVFGTAPDPKPNLPRWKRFLFSLRDRVVRQWRKYDWVGVRSISELQILTRVSYLALIIVPLLAGTWPAVRVMVNKYNNAITDAATHFDEASQTLDAITSQITPTPPDAANEAEATPLSLELSETLTKLDQIDAQSEEWIRNYGPKTIERPDMPDVFAVSFFAALFVVLGHLVYQTSSPELIRPRSRRQYMRESLESFDERAGDRDLRLRKAMQRLKDAQDRMPWNRHQNFVHRDGDTVWVPSEMERFIRKPPQSKAAQVSEGEQPDDSAGQPEATTTETASEEYDSTLMRVTIEEGAKAEYDVEARENLRYAWLSGIFYLIATILIGWIVLGQSMNIGDAAGWWDSPLIEHVEDQPASDSELSAD